MPAPVARLAVALTLASLTASAPTGTAQSMDFEAYQPISTLVVPEHPLTAARYPFVDCHSHIWGMPDQDLDQLVADMDAMNMAVMVNLSGRGWGEEPDYLQRSLDAAARHPGRFLIFTNISFEGIDEPGWGERTADQVEADVRAGCVGLKIYKNLGLTAVDAAGERIATNDPRIFPVWERCGELGIPVLIHTGEPSAFWEPRDEHNERWLELKQRPGRYRDPALYPSWEETMEEQWDMFRRHPRTTFFAAHLGWLGNDLDRLGRLLDEMPNVVTEIGAVLAELGRQPRHARRFLEQYADRVFFGKDSWEPTEYHTYFRCLETDDDFFDYYRRRHAWWKIYGLDLPDHVLRKIYYENALRLFPSIDRSRFEGLLPEHHAPAERFGSVVDFVSDDRLAMWEGLVYAAYFDGMDAEGRRVADVRTNLREGEVRDPAVHFADPLSALRQLEDQDVVGLTPAILNAVAGRALDDAWQVERIGRLIHDWQRRVAWRPRFHYDDRPDDDTVEDVAKRVRVIEQWWEWWRGYADDPDRLPAYREKLEGRRDGR